MSNAARPGQTTTLAAHGIEVLLPSGWDGRIFKRVGAGPVMHLGTFPLLASDGDFGAAATGRMRRGDVFVALLEYADPRQITPGRGLFAAQGLPRWPRAEEFSGSCLQVTRTGQLGWQRFFTVQGRTCCLYTVLKPRFGEREALAEDLRRVLSTLTVSSSATIPTSASALAGSPPHVTQL